MEMKIGLVRAGRYMNWVGRDGGHINGTYWCFVWPGRINGTYWCYVLTGRFKGTYWCFILTERIMGRIGITY